MVFTKKVEEQIISFKNKKVLVWGDFILDEFIYTKTSRISREAPVLINRFQSSEVKPGGAGNVLMNLKALGAEPIPVGLYGKDEHGRKLLDYFNNMNINTSYMIEDKNYQTAVKSRIMAGGDNTKKQQILRIDKLHEDFGNIKSKKKFVANILELSNQVDALLISDYLNHSVKSEIYYQVLDTYKSKFIAIDSRFNLKDFRAYTIATPNAPEIRELYPSLKYGNKESYIEAGMRLLNESEAKNIVVKLGHKGMLIFNDSGVKEDLGIYGSSDIVDVTGAGDTVISLITLSMISGMSLLDSAKLATIGAGMVVMKAGTCPVYYEELADELKKNIE